MTPTFTCPRCVLLVGIIKERNSDTGSDKTKHYKNTSIIQECRLFIFSLYLLSGSVISSLLNDHHSIYIIVFKFICDHYEIDIQLDRYY